MLKKLVNGLIQEPINENIMLILLITSLSMIFLVQISITLDDNWKNVIPNNDKNVNNENFFQDVEDKLWNSIKQPKIQFSSNVDYVEIYEKTHVSSTKLIYDVVEINESVTVVKSK